MNRDIVTRKSAKLAVQAAVHDDNKFARPGAGKRSRGAGVRRGRAMRSCDPVRKRDGPDSLAQTRHILRSARAVRQGLRRQRQAM